MRGWIGGLPWFCMAHLTRPTALTGSMGYKLAGRLFERWYRNSNRSSTNNSKPMGSSMHASHIIVVVCFHGVRNCSSQSRSRSWNNNAAMANVSSRSSASCGVMGCPRVGGLSRQGLAAPPGQAARTVWHQHRAAASAATAVVRVIVTVQCAWVGYIVLVCASYKRFVYFMQAMNQ